MCAFESMSRVARPRPGGLAVLGPGGGRGAAARRRPGARRGDRPGLVRAVLPPVAPGVAAGPAGRVGAPDHRQPGHRRSAFELAPPPSVLPGGGVGPIPQSLVASVSRWALAYAIEADGIPITWLTGPEERPVMPPILGHALSNPEREASSRPHCGGQSTGGQALPPPSGRATIVARFRLSHGRSTTSCCAC